MTEDPMIPDYLLDYLESATLPELEQVELLRLGRASDIAKHLTASIKELVKAEAEAMVARLLIERRRKAKAKLPPPATTEVLAEVIPGPSVSVIEEKLRRLEHPNGGRNGKKT